MKIFAVMIAIGMAAFWGLWLVAVPEDFITHFIAKSLVRMNMKIEAEGVKKGLFCNFGVNRILVKNENNRLLLTIKNVEGRLNFTSIVKLSPQMDFHGNINDGEISGNISLKRADGISEIKGNNIEIHGIPDFGQLGINGTGNLAFDLRKVNDRVEIKFSLLDANIRGALSQGAGSLPLDMFQKATGVLVIENGFVAVKSLVLEGKGIYVRVRGEMRGDKKNLKIEVMDLSSR